MTEILVVDDDRDVAQSIELALRRHDVRVTLAYSGVEALKTLRRYRPDLVIVDVLMPGMSGLEFLAQVAVRHPKVARLLITGWPEEIPPDQIELLGIRALIPKPWDDQQLRSVLRKNT